MTGFRRRVLVAILAAVVCLGAGCAVAGGGLGAALAVVGALTAWLFVGAGTGACNSVDGCLSPVWDRWDLPDDAGARDDGADDASTDGGDGAGADGAAEVVDTDTDVDTAGEVAPDGVPEVGVAPRKGPGPARGTSMRTAQQRLASAGVLSPDQLARLRRLQGRRV